MRYNSTKKWFALVAMIGLWGCRGSLQEAEPTIQFSVATPMASKSIGLSAGDKVAVCARLDGVESYFLQHATFTIGADGRLTASPAVYYPQVKQAVTFYAYFPYHTGLFSVPSDQSTAAALKQADLCWATASSTPVSTLVPLEFEHTMARLVVTANQTPEKIAVPNALVGGSLDVSAGVFTATSRSEVSTTGSELIVPGQSVSRLIVTVGGVEYVFEGSIDLQSGQTTTLNLTLNPSTKTATLNGTTTTAWSIERTTGLPIQPVSNTLTFHWPYYDPKQEVPDRIVLTIEHQNMTSEFTVSSGITYNDHTFVVPLSSPSVQYPYRITTLRFYRANMQPVVPCSHLVGSTIYRSGVATIGVRDQNRAIMINGLWWATGNLVAAGGQGGRGQGGCLIGNPEDGGLYFQFGSLIGWKGGAVAYGGTGQGVPPASWGGYWNGAGALSWANDAMVWPIEMKGNPTTWPTNIANQWYFGLSSGWSTQGQNIRNYPGFVQGTLADLGVGDPCTYYLGSVWRQPSLSEQQALVNDFTTSNAGWPAPWSSTTLAARWVSAGTTMNGRSGPGIWVGPGIRTNSSSADVSKNLWVPQVGGRNASSGAFVSLSGARAYAAVGSSQIGSNTYSLCRTVLYLDYSYGLAHWGGIDRTTGVPMRCVAL